MNNYFNKPFVIFNNLTNREYIKDTVIFNNKLSSISVYFSDEEINNPDVDGLKLFQKFDTKILWDFGDGTTIYGKSATHVYTEPGIYYITCTCFDADGNPYKNAYDVSNTRVQVISILDTSLSFTNNYCKKLRENQNLIENVYAGEKINAGEFVVKLDKSITKNVPITCSVINSLSQEFLDENNTEQYFHLLPYHSFYDKDDNPVKSIVPKYYYVYVTLEVNDPEHLYFDTEDNNNIITDSIIDNNPKGSNIKTENKIAQNKLTFYVLINDSNENNFNLQDITLEHFKNTLNFVIETKYILDVSELNKDLTYSYVGKLGYSNVSFIEDTPVEEIKLIYNLDQDYFPETNIKLAKHTINLVSIGIQTEIKKNLANNPNISYDFVYSTNGLFSDISKQDVLSLENNRYSLERAMYLNVANQIVFRIRGYDSLKNEYYFPKDLTLSIDNFNISPINSCEIEINQTMNDKFNNFGSAFIYLTPKIETEQFLTNLQIFVRGIDENGIEFYPEIDNNNFISISDLLFIDLQSFLNNHSKFYLNPEQNYTDYSTDEIWTVHKVHPSVENVPNLDKFMLAILGSNDFLQKVINKGNNFVDDIANVNTSSILNLISILKSIDVDVDLFNNENFNSPNKMADLLKIISINHSRLLGNKIKVNDEFVTDNNTPGKNLGKEIKITEQIFINDNKYPIIVTYDKFSREYFKIDTYSLTILDPSPFREENGKKYFCLDQYEKRWGWNLILNFNEYNKDITLKDNNQINIPKYYQFFEYIESNEQIRENSYLKPNTLLMYDENSKSYIDNQNIIDRDTWIKADGSIDRLLYKTLIDTLDLKAL